jgi:hypothetical protein
MVKDLLVTYPIMTIVISTLIVSYVIGVALVVSSLLNKRQWIEDENGQLHYTPRAR